MNLFDHFYYNYVRSSMSYIGAWPYDRSYSQILRAVGVVAYLCNFLILQLLRMVTSNYDITIVLEIIPIVIGMIILFIKLTTAWLNLTVIKSLLDRMQQHWEVFSAESENRILEEYAYRTKLMRMIYIAVVEGALFVLILQQVSPGFLDIVLPLNQSRPRRHMFEAEYFVDKNEYYYPILAHMISVVQLAIWCLLGTDLPYVIAAFHACGVSDVVGHKFLTAYDQSEHHDCKNGKSCSVLIKLEDCVKSHRMLISYMNSINSCYSNSYAVQCLCAIVAQTIICLQLFKSIIHMNVQAGVVYIIQLVAFSIPTCYVIIPGQVVLNASYKLYQTVYCGRWYLSCIPSQRILVVVMRMCHEPLCLFISCCVIMSLETLVTVLKAPMSFFMAFYPTYS